MQKLMLASGILLLLVSCKEATTDKKFVIDGVISNSTAKMVYLEKVPAATMQPMITDSAELGKEGKFTLKADATESVVFNLRLDQSKYPVASVINDVKQLKLKIELSKDNNQFAEKYEVEGSPASQQMKDFMVTFNNDLQKIFVLAKNLDSLQKEGVSDSLLFPLAANQQQLTEKIKTNSVEALGKAKDPALIMFELGYYQSTANGAGFGLVPMTDEEVIGFVNNAATKYPSHQAVASIKASFDQQAKSIEKAAAASWVGKEAPDFSMPDVNGSTVKLSSFSGKYVLVDFWASWCGPCRQENPNVVKAYAQFKNKNFTVLGVSLDRPGQKDKWIKAINDDNLMWTNISDLQFWNSPVVSLYGFDGIPFNILVAPDGKVIAENLRGMGLMSKLAEVLK